VKVWGAFRVAFRVEKVFNKPVEKPPLIFALGSIEKFLQK
jgi:hypothetical protein